jgi:hypothetical protein
MAAIPRIASVSLVSAVAIGLVVAIGVAPPAAAEPCPGTSAENPALPNAGSPPVGRRPAHANEHAPLPSLGKLPLAILKSITGRSAPVQQQAAVIPSPNPGGGGNQTPSYATEQVPMAPPPAPAAPEFVGPPDALGASSTSLDGWVTGPDSPSNTPQRFGISGTDLGIMWDSGNDQVLMAFGDTYGNCNVRGRQWRYNTLLRSQDRSLDHGLTVSSAPEYQPGLAKQIINSIHWAPTETGIIPTAGVAVGRYQYVNFMSIRQWGNPGQWSTNFSAIAVSPDNGQNWGIYPGTIRAAGPDTVARVPFVDGNENFQQGAFLRGGDGYVYSFGTPPGRNGPAYVARVPQGYLPDLTKYQYWNGGDWVPGNPAAATPVIPGQVGEMSAQYNTYLKQYLAMYCNDAGDILARTAPAPQGPWGPEQMLVSSAQMPGGIYAPFMHPWSTGKDVYFDLSLWSAYSVMLMHTVLP